MTDSRGGERASALQVSAVGRGLVPRRLLLLAVLALAVLGAGAAIGQTADPPIVFVHGNGDTAALWHTTIWRFESNPSSSDHSICSSSLWMTSSCVNPGAA